MATIKQVICYEIMGSDTICVSTLCLPDITSCDQISQAIPAYTSDQILEVRTATTCPYMYELQCIHINFTCVKCVLHWTH